MKVTKTADYVSALNAQKASANAGCQQCPCCGETKKDWEYIEEGIINKGISGGWYKSWAEGWFRMRSMRCDCYKCYTCGAEWESEPYQGA